nr:protein ECERIFERUM 26-like [Ipomoea batatas]
MSEHVSSSICKRTVVSTKIVQPGKFCPLTVLDRVMENNFVRIVFYYRDLEFGKDYMKLNESIAETLNAYTIIMGRLLRSPGEQWLIKCNDAGLRVIEAKAKGSVDEWLHNVDRDKELKLVHWEPMYSESYFWSPFYVQITEFEEGGVSIGLSCTHLLADPTSATMFIKAWADMTFTGKMISPPHFHPLPPRRPYNHNPNHDHIYSAHLINHYKKPTTDDKPPSHQTSSDRPTTITLLFTEEMVRACMSMAQTADAFDAPAGLFWTRISKAKNVGLMDLTVGLDVRKVLGLDKGFYGNCMVYNKVKWSSGSMVLGDDLLSQAANAIRNMIKEMDKEGIMDLIEWLDQNNCRASNVLDGCDSLVCVNLEGVDPYLACFGDNIDPVHVSYYVEPEIGPGNRLLILPSPPGTGALSRTVMVTLPENEAVKLMEDQLIHQLSPCIKMGV